jgi:hypothetical protein
VTGVFVVVAEDLNYREQVIVATVVLSSAWAAYRREVNEQSPGVTVRIERWVEHAERAEVLVYHYTEMHVTTSARRQAARRRRKQAAHAHRTIDQIGEQLAHTWALLGEPTPF